MADWVKTGMERLDVGTSVLSECARCGGLHCIRVSVRYVKVRGRGWRGDCSGSCPAGEHLHATERCARCFAAVIWPAPVGTDPHDRG